LSLVFSYHFAMRSASAVVVTYSKLKCSLASFSLPLIVRCRSPNYHQKPSKLSYASRAEPNVKQPIWKSSTFVAGPSVLMFNGP
jgi:hypothetical protein